MNGVDVVLASEEMVLVDSSMRKERGVSIAREIFECRRYSQLDPQKIKNGRRDIELLKTILEHSNTATIEEVTEEIRALEEILNQKLGFLPRQDLKTNKFHYEGKRVERSRRAEQELKNLQRIVYKTRELSKKRELHLKDPRYKVLEKMVELISLELPLKKDTGYMYGEHETDESKDSLTDDRLAATLFYLSMFSDSEPGLLTADTDFVSLCAVIPKLIGAYEFYPKNKQFRIALKKNPFNLYLFEKPKCCLALNSSEIRFDNGFNLWGVKNSEEIKRKVRDYWDEFVKVKNEQCPVYST